MSAPRRLRSGPRRLAPGLALAACWSSGTAAAQVAPQDPATTMAVSAPPCIERPFDRARLLELLRVELLSLGLSGVSLVPPGGAANGPAPPFPATVTLAPDSCDPELTEITLRIVDRASYKAVERRMAIGDVALAERPRALAIGIAELLAASWAELMQAPQLPPELAPPIRAALAARATSTEDAARAEAESVVSRFREATDRARRGEAARAEARKGFPLAELGVLVRAFPGRATALFGGGLLGRARLSGPLTVHVAADVAAGDVRANEGAIAVGAALASAGAGFSFGGPAELEIGPRLHGGYGWARGRAYSDQFSEGSHGGGLFLAGASATVRLPGSGAWLASAGVDTGYTIAGLSFASSTSRLAGLEGPFIALRVGGGLEL